MSYRKGFSLTELVVVIVIIGVLAGLLLPAVQVNHGHARSAYCTNHFKFIGLAVHNYHSAYKALPPTMFGTPSNGERLSALVALLPFLEEQALWETISHPSEEDGRAFPAFGPHPRDTSYQPWNTQVATFRCPADPSEPVGCGRTNYTLCVGDQADRFYNAVSLAGVRGFASPSVSLTFRDIDDGLAYTVMMTEIATKMGRRVSGNFAFMSEAVLDDPSVCLRTVDPNEPVLFADKLRLSVLGRGGAWAEGAGGFALVNTILPPNSPSCSISQQTPHQGVLAAGSYHQGGCHVLLGDGAVKYITDSVDCGDGKASVLRNVNDTTGKPVGSPFGIWGAIGTRAGGEEIADQF